MDGSTQNHYERHPAPSTRPSGMDRSAWAKVKKRGWYCPYFSRATRGVADGKKKDRPGPERTFNYHGEDYLTPQVTEWEGFFGWTFNHMLAVKGLTWDYIKRQNPGIEREDFIHEGIVRALELRSDPRGNDNWRFFANVAESAQFHFLRALRRHTGIVRLDEQEPQEEERSF